MSEEDRHFILKRIFPEASSILNIRTKKVDEIFKTALFVLDTNTLLVPFQAGKDGIEKIRKIYAALVSEERIYIPNHVLREFAKNRSLKISDLFTNIDNLISSSPTIKPFEYPILSELDTYKAIKEKRDLILKELKCYNQYLSELKNGITDWNWSDPVSTMYSTTFNEKSIIDTASNEKDLLGEYHERIQNDIPPGNKDKLKDTNAIGDFLIWKSILKLGIEKQRDVIFVSNDEKNDWLLKGNKKSIHTKFELVNEFYSETKGKNFASINFIKFLELQGVEIELSKNYDSDNFASDDISEFDKGSLHSLKKIYHYIFEYIDNYGDMDDEDIYITDKINVHIANYLSIYQDEFYNTSKWKYYANSLIRFADILSNIKSLNDEIQYQSHRQKRSTYSQMIEMKALSKKFIELYEEFKIREMWL